MKSPLLTSPSAESLFDIISETRPISRRSVLKLCGATVAAGVSWTCFGTSSALSGPLIIIEKAQGLVVADPTRCIGCRRCELACTEFNDGKSSSALARIKVWRNLNFGPTLAHAGLPVQGDWGSGLIVQDVCKQCAHPVPCADACPHGAIVAKPPTNARAIDSAVCTGCKLCLKACPWEMISFDPQIGKASKCFLCDGRPKCVEACPAGALTYVPWVDLTGKIPPRIDAAVIRPTCGDCHQ